MTGYAKQSMARQNGKLDCSVTCAPRNDEKRGVLSDERSGGEVTVIE
jgi:hypothetical protein